ncbi:hypothetical protein G7Y89_g2906 [Cudoniella acicularis]|uniref:Uncharacterized protein n=1 Tax=Cudoniella acicularis TaxID=354080 RepID=A0A8H4RUI2_9HELO|nr:hypothetical protein G7Y89_g2906 [Cudoniella acicularis]
MLLGAPDMLNAPVITIGVVPYICSSKDVIPYGPEQGPATTPEAGEKAQAMLEFIKRATWRSRRELLWVLEVLNVPKDAEIPELLDLDRLADRSFSFNRSRYYKCSIQL